MSYPNTLDNFTPKVDHLDDVMAGDINELQTSIMSAQQFFGTEIQFGWLPLPACTYVSATSFTLAGDWTSYLKAGARWKGTNVTAKYGRIAASSYSSGTGLTTVTLEPNLSQALESAAITGAYVSYANPPDYPASLETQLQLGWIALPACTYVSATSFTLAGDWTSYLKAGARWKGTNVTAKYGRIAASSYSSGTGLTTVTLEPNLSQALESAAITGAYVSYANPPDYPASLETQLQLGWIALPACTYVSATSFTLQGDWTSFLKLGAKFKATNSTLKYGYILSSSYDGGTGLTTVNLVANTSYSLASAAITGAYISYANPPDHPEWLNGTYPLYGESGSAGTYAEDVKVSKFSLVGRSCALEITKKITDKGSWAGGVRMDAPLGLPASSESFSAGEVIANGQIARKAIAHLYGNRQILFEDQIAARSLDWSLVSAHDWVIISIFYPIG